MTNTDFDYGGFEEDTDSSDKLSQLHKLAADHRAAEVEVVECEAALAKAQARVRDYAENLIPSAMEELKLKTFTTQSGIVIAVEEKIRASMPEAFRPRAFIWLREHGHGALIKHEIKLDFSMGEDEKAAALLKQLQEAGYEVEEKEAVHPSTLVSFVKEKLTKGEDLPDDLFSIFRANVAKLTLPKAKGKR